MRAWIVSGYLFGPGGGNGGQASGEQQETHACFALLACSEERWVCSTHGELQRVATLSLQCNAMRCDAGEWIESMCVWRVKGSRFRIHYFPGL
jgi:hypothetical protein